MSSCSKGYKYSERKAVQFIAHDKDSNSNFPFIFHDRILGNILNNEEVANLPIALYSVAGQYRTGKSFLLNLFIHLHQSGSLNHKNLDLNDTTYGFKWKGGKDSFTDGLWILNKPFILQKPNGKKVALFLMDTEGTDEPNKSQEISNAIFSISTLLSSFQIFNIKHPITEEQLRKLELISSLGEHCTKKVGYLEEKTMLFVGGVKQIGSKVGSFANAVRQNIGYKLGETESGQQLRQKHNTHQSTLRVYPFQTLLFLIRDYPKATIKKQKSSSECGMKVLEDILNEDESTVDEVRRVRKNVKSAFESTKCFVLRNPGEEVFDSDEDLECLPVGDVNKDFLSQVKELFDLCFNAENIVIKKINGKPVTCSELYNHSQKILNLYRSGKVPQVANIIEATDDAIMTKAIETGKKDYKCEMQKKCGENYMNEADLKKTHNECKHEVMTTIEDIQCLGSEEHKQKHIKKFEEEIEKMWEMKKMKNDLLKHELMKVISKKVEDLESNHKLILKEKTSEPYPLNESVFKEFVNSEEAKTLKRFGEETKEYAPDLLEQPLKNLEQKIALNKNVLKDENQNKERKCKLLLEKSELDLIKTYEEAMYEKGHLHAIELSQILENDKTHTQNVLNRFEELFEDYPDFLKDPARVSLRQNIKKTRDLIEQRNSFLLKQKEKDLEITSKIHSYYEKSMVERINGTYNTSDQIQEFHEESMRRALELAEKELGPKFDKYKNILTDYFEFLKVDFNISNQNFKKKAETKFKQKLEHCYDYYNSNMKEEIKLQYNTDCDLQKKHLKCKADAVREFNKIRNEVVGPEEEFHEIKSQLEKQIDERLQLFLDENEDYKANEDQVEERAWNNAVLKFKYEIKRAMNENKRKKNDKVQEEYLKFVQSLVEEYKNDVATRYKSKVESLEKVFESIYAEEKEACIIL